MNEIDVGCGEEGWADEMGGVLYFKMLRRLEITMLGAWVEMLLASA